MSLFTPVSGFLGGTLIGQSAATLMLFNGDIMGVSGILTSTCLTPMEMLRNPAHYWKLAFVSGFMGASVLLSDYAIDKGMDDGMPFISSIGTLIGGFLVGFGTKLGNGCTTGHGICGLGRLSRRSIVSVATFMASSIATASFIQTPGNKYTSFLRSDVEDGSDGMVGTAVTAVVALTTFLVAPFVRKQGAKKDSSDEKTQAETKSHISKVGPAIVSGAFFAAGLAFSQMLLVSKMYGFLQFSRISDGNWDPTLVTVFAGGFVVSFLGYQFVPGHGVFKNSKALECPYTPGTKFGVPTNTVIDAHLVLGAVAFGAGWGISGLCPGPALFLAATGTWSTLLYWWPSFFAGAYVAKRLKEG